MTKTPQNGSGVTLNWTYDAKAREYKVTVTITKEHLRRLGADEQDMSSIVDGVMERLEDEAPDIVSEKAEEQIDKTTCPICGDRTHDGHCCVRVDVDHWEKQYH